MDHPSPAQDARSSRQQQHTLRPHGSHAGPDNVSQATTRPHPPPMYIRTPLPPPPACAPAPHVLNNPAATSLYALQQQSLTPIGVPAQHPPNSRPTERRPLQQPLPMWSLDGKYRLVSTLARPSDPAAMNGGVHTIVDPISGVICVQKVVRVGQPSRRKAFDSELAALYTIRNEQAPDCINRIISHFHDPALNLASITLDYCSKGNLADLISRHRAANVQMPLCSLFNIGWSLARALCFLHYGIRDFSAPLPPLDVMLACDGILHLDIKPENVFLKPNPGSTISPFRVVLGDFGCSVTCHERTTGAVDPHVQSHGTEGWFPPENTHSPLYVPTQQAPSGYYGRRTDIWQVGGVLQCLGLLQRVPVQELVDEEIPLGPTQRYGEHIEAVVSQCMARNLQVRASAPRLGHFILAQAYLADVELEM